MIHSVLWQKKGYIVSEMITDDQLMFQEFIQSRRKNLHCKQNTIYSYSSLESENALQMA